METPALSTLLLAALLLLALAPPAACSDAVDAERAAGDVLGSDVEREIERTLSGIDRGGERPKRLFEPAGTWERTMASLEDWASEDEEEEDGDGTGLAVPGNRANLDPKDTPGHRFVTAAYKGDIATMKHLILTEDVNPDFAQDADGEFAIHIAASAGQVEVLKYLVDELRQDVDMTDAEGATALLAAAWHGHIPAFEYLLSRGANIHHHCDNGWGVVMGAVRWGEAEMLHYLQDHNVLFHHTEAEGEWTPLMVAAAQGDIHIVDILLQNGADPLHMDSQGRDAIDLAEKNGFHVVANRLLKAAEERGHGDLVAAREPGHGHEIPHRRPNKKKHSHHHGHSHQHAHHSSHRHDEL